MSGTIEWRPQAALDRILARLVAATEAASAQGADRARDIAPLGKGEHQATGSNPRFFSVRLQTTHEFNRATKRGTFTRRQRQARAADLVRLKDLRLLGRSELVSQVTQPDVQFFRFSSGSRKGEQPDYLDVRPARGPGGEAVKGAVTHYTPGRLKKGIRPIAVKIKGNRVSGGFESTAPYSNLVEHGFHHKGGTQVEPVNFMRTSTENLREEWNSGAFFKE